MSKNNTKLELQQTLILLFNEKIKSLKEQLISLKESRDSDSKSSVGDKYETSRAMAHIEIGKHEQQLINSQHLKAELNKIVASRKSEVVGFGSVIYTNKGNYFMAVAHGKVSVLNQQFYAISLASPIGKALFGKQVGDAIHFNGHDIIVESIL